MFKKFTDTLSGTLDTVKSYGSSMGIGQSGQGQDGTAGTATGTTGPTTGVGGKLTLNLPVLGNGSVSAPASTLNTPDPTQSQKSSIASNTILGIQNTLGKITGRSEAPNSLVVASHQSNRGRGPALGRAVETNESMMTDFHTLEDDQKVSSYHDITSYEQYKKVSDTGQMKQLESQLDYGLPVSTGMNGSAPKIVRSNTDEIIDQEFAAAKVNLDDVLDQAEYVDELTPVATKEESEDKEKKKPKKKRNKCLQAIINCLQDNRVKGGCVDPEEMAEAAEGHVVLKKVLNIVFMVIGTLLFAAVFVVIIYTSVVPEKTKDNDILPTTTSAFLSNETVGIYDYTLPPDFDLDSMELKPEDEEAVNKIRNSFNALFLSSSDG